MFLKVFKKKSNQNFINTLLLNRKIAVNDKKIKSIGVLFNAEEFTNTEYFTTFFKELNIQFPNQKFFTFSKETEIEQTQWDTIFTPRDFGWNGNLKNNELQNFTNYEFDVLICYFLKNEPELTQIVAMSKANFKVGISNIDDRLYDLIIDVKPSNFEAFKTELKKYLTILNKL